MKCVLVAQSHDFGFRSWDSVCALQISYDIFPLDFYWVWPLTLCFEFRLFLAFNWLHGLDSALVSHLCLKALKIQNAVFYVINLAWKLNDVTMTWASIKYAIAIMLHDWLQDNFGLWCWKCSNLSFSTRC